MGNSALQSRILVLGTDGAGKTTFLNKYENPNQDIAATPTQAYVVRDIKLKGVKFNVWDVSGKESTRALWKHYYKEGGTDAIIWVIDSSSSDEKIEESRQCLHNAMMDPSLDGVILAVLANKQDVDGAKSPEEMTEKLNLKVFEGKRPWFIKGISAKTGSGIREALEHLSKEVKTFYKKKQQQQQRPN
eukprot:TRINITY_DN1082_c0_g1_i2.p1 TRINITY_DN1082_c0_g1~~TRINITY_DN1082_c0_g1_i2.p1  ORF type:complete len:188 (+),score=49.99 TRINITY_DN1082_c0_g1_i2:119-682(+)